MVIQAEVVPDIVEADLVAAVQETMEMVLVVMSGFQERERNITVHLHAVE